MCTMSNSNKLSHNHCDNRVTHGSMQSHPRVGLLGVAVRDVTCSAVWRGKTGEPVVHVGDVHRCSHEACS